MLKDGSVKVKVGYVIRKIGKLWVYALEPQKSALKYFVHTKAFSHVSNDSKCQQIIINPINFSYQIFFSIKTYVLSSCE